MDLNNSKRTLMYIGLMVTLTVIFYNNIWVPVVKPELTKWLNINVIEAIVVLLYFLLLVVGYRFEQVDNLGIEKKQANVVLIAVVIYSPLALISLLDIMMSFVFNKG